MKYFYYVATVILLSFTASMGLEIAAHWAVFSFTSIAAFMFGVGALTTAYSAVKSLEQSHA